MHTLPKLKFEYGALEPYFDEATMKLHHSKHHQTYVDKLNEALVKHPELAEKSLEELLSDLKSVPEDIRIAVRNHGGGHSNHSFFWNILKPNSDGKASVPTGKLLEDINKTFSSFENFQKLFKDTALARFGSGWVWLVCPTEGNRVASDGKLKIISTANQDTPLELDFIPIIGLDVWEHAYYLKYQNRRADFIDAFFYLIDWNSASVVKSN
ncbi:MAG: superoxide dismutase [Patescibacteria group bacterium]